MIRLLLSHRKPLHERWLAARRTARRAQAPAGRYVDDVWVDATPLP
jgi:hypothetical protein